ncbi:hypothetical protein ACLOJK_000831 [Asimina triloba]
MIKRHEMYTCRFEAYVYENFKRTVPSPGAASPCACDIGLDVGKGLPLGGRALEVKLPVEYELIRAEVARLRTELEALRVERLQVRLAREGNSLPTRSTPSTAVLVITEYLRSDAYQQRMEYGHSHHAQSGYAKALLDIHLLFPDMDLTPLYKKP